MKISTVLVRIFSVLFLLCFSVYSYSRGQDIPIGILGKSISDLQKNYPSSLTEIKYPVEEDSSNMMVAWKFINDSGYSIVIMDKDKDGISDTLVVNSAHFKTDKNIGVGDRLDKVMSAYPDARFKGDFNMPELIVVYAENGKLKFTFDTTGIALEKVIREGEFSIKNKDIAKAPVWSIYIR